MKRLFLRPMHAYDLRHGTSYVRLIEMTVDGILKKTGYSLQFWKDVEVYGLHEAFVYLKNNTDVYYDRCLPELENLENLVDKLCPQILDNKPPPPEDQDEELPI